jgi:hypothetical protein
MIPAFSCGSLRYINLLDFAYLSLNVYHELKDDPLLGQRPRLIGSTALLKENINELQDAWYQLAFPALTLPTNNGFYAEYYAKIINHEIIATMISIRGTDHYDDYKEDYHVWCKSVTDSNNTILNNPSYQGVAGGFYSSCREAMMQIEDAGLAAKNTKLYFTGHSLGGALANLHIGNYMTTYPSVPWAVTFNAPGVGDIKGIDKNLVIQEHVVSMRAHYDFVSAIGEPYGLVVNNHIPEGCKDAKNAFELEHQLNNPQTKKHADVLDHALSAANHMVDEINDRTEQAYDITQALLEQHSMNNFLKVICSSDKALTPFEGLRSYAHKNYGWNHDETAANWIAA